MRRPLALALFACAFAARADAADLVVSPGQSIQTAIDTAQNGDRLLLQPGTYFQHSLDLKGKTIKVIGVGGAAATIVDASGLFAGVFLMGGGGNFPVLEGLTIRNGVVGVFIGGATYPTIRGCVIEDHLTLGFGPEVPERGCGIFGGNAGTKVIDSVIRRNDRFGVQGGCELVRCVIRENGQGYQSSGLAVGALIECRVLRNDSFGISMQDNWSPLAGTQALIERCEITENGGGGIGVNSYFGFGARIVRCRIADNLGAGVSLYSFNPQKQFSVAGTSIESCIITGNVALDPGAGAHLTAISFSSPPASSASVLRSTIANNFPNGLHLNANFVEVRNSILWNQPNPIVTPFSPATVTHCDVEGGLPGIGNFAADPQFVDAANGDYHIRSTSPCVNAGFGSNAPDFEGDLTTGAVDVGGDEFGPQLALTGDPAPGGNVRLGIYGVPGSAPVLLFVSLGRLDTPVATPYGGFGLAFPLIAGFPLDLGAMPPGSAITFPGVIPPSAPAGVSLHMQVFLGGSSAKLTNVESLVIG